MAMYLNRYRIAFALAIATATGLVALSELGYRRADEASDALREVYANRLGLLNLLNQMLDAETGQRGFLLTGDPAYLKPYDRATAEIGEALTNLRQHYVARPEGLGKFGELSRMVSRKLAEMEVTVELRKQGSEPVDWMKAVDTGIGRRYMDNVRSQVDVLIADVNVVRDALHERIDRNLLVARISVGLGALTALLAFYLYLRQAARSDRLSVQRAEELASEKERLDRLVDERTQDLTALATQLQNVQEAERDHLARELHDEMGAVMTAAKLDVARLKALLQPMSPAVAERIDHLVASLNAGIALKRRITEDLRPSALSDLGLVPAIENLVRDVSQRSEVKIELDLDPVEPSAATALTIYRTIQESLTNVLRHARAKHVWIRMHHVGGVVQLHVRDDGIGFKMEDRLNASRGLAGIRHRVHAAQGKLRIKAAPDQGCEISASFPLQSSPSQGNV